MVRLTNDIDVVIRVKKARVEGLVEVLVNAKFHIDADTSIRAIRLERPFNVIHIPSAFRFDLIPVGSSLYDQVQFARRRFEEIPIFGNDPIELSVATPEDVILSKLRWYRLGGGTSNVQWNDVLGVIAVQRDHLDYAYLRRWAQFLGLSQLLEEVLAERHEPMWPSE